MALSILGRASTIKCIESIPNISPEMFCKPQIRNLQIAERTSNIPSGTFAGLAKMQAAPPQKD
jgi:hypothetical protein